MTRVRSQHRVDGDLLQTFDPQRVRECGSPFEALRPIEEADRERAAARGLPVREYLSWRDNLRGDYREMLLWPRFSMLANLPLRGWMVPGADMTTAEVWGGRRARPVV